MELRIENLSVSFGEKNILSNISFGVKSGEMLALIGESGCGKTTLIKTLAGLNIQKFGDIFIGEKNVNRLVPEKRKAVIVFQDLRLFPHLNVEKNISFAMEIQKKTKEEQRDKVVELLKLVQLEGFEKRKIAEISGGQMQRVALARALASEPNLLLLDEPFSSLDERLRKDMANLVKKIQRDKRITTILVTHDKSEALRVADQVALMKDGKILQKDSPYNIFYNPNDIHIAEYFGNVNKIGNRFVRPSRMVVEDGEDYIIEDIAFLGEQLEIKALRVNLDKSDDYKSLQYVFVSMKSHDFYDKNLKKGSKVNVREQ